MKKLIKWSMPLAVVFVLSACNGQKNQQENSLDHHDGMGMEQTAEMPMEEVQKVVIKDASLNAVYQHYVHLTNALIDSDVAETQSAAAAIEVGMKDMGASEKMVKTAAQITEAKDLEKQRLLYATLSDDLIPLIKKAGLSSGELNVDFCPMAGDQKGAYWLAGHKDIKNPYMGSKMMTCGSVKETLKKL
ncbi:uncharacterized protein DUF3347 [Dyadobacter jejuensis]|uniref:Uncharacterized protein DUF3347 n=1 Tax=Dyadobacter jejuensis TaxID=1082580 RepID=A0A316AMY5_9BACT|nr:DUF3347 domain-containing protein [Dyadobacter jejuensis]PWJ58669.1 uncharacterized protein DUF3347 [Dyadobacter jejuensis]